jgi:ligand-binding sensor protein
MAESALQRKLILGELLDLASFTNVCKTFVDLYKIGVKVFDSAGTKLVDIKVASGDFCAYMFTGPNGRRLCTETVTHIKVRPLEAPNLQPQIASRNCFSGLRYLMMPIVYEGDVLGRIIFGPFFPEELADLGQDLKALEGEFDLAKARDLIGRIRRAPESTVRKVLEHFARVVDVLVYTSHKAVITSQLHIEAVTESCRASSRASSPPSRTSCARRSPR